jgi:hypothetical protein
VDHEPANAREGMAGPDLGLHFRSRSGPALWPRAEKHPHIAAPPAPVVTQISPPQQFVNPDVAGGTGQVFAPTIGIAASAGAA